MNPGQLHGSTEPALMPCYESKTSSRSIHTLLHTVTSPLQKPGSTIKQAPKQQAFNALV